MKFRLTGIHEQRKPEETEGDPRPRVPYYMVPLRPGEFIIVGYLSALDDSYGDCSFMYVPMESLPEGSKLGDEFEIEFKPIKKLR